MCFIVFHGLFCRSRIGIYGKRQHFRLLVLHKKDCITSLVCSLCNLILSQLALFDIFKIIKQLVSWALFRVI